MRQICVRQRPAGGAASLRISAFLFVQFEYDVISVLKSRKVKNLHLRQHFSGTYVFLFFG